MGNKTVAIIQARMGSTRLPGKVLQHIWGKPLLWHVLHRVRKCRRVNEIVVATSTSPADDAIEEYCDAHDVMLVRGPEDNVLARFDLAVQATNPSVIVRVNADAPLIDPTFVDHMIRTVTDEDADTVMGSADTPCIHDGVDPVSRVAFDRLVSEVGDDPVVQEHVTGYFKKDPAFGKIAELTIERGLQFEGARLSIDTQADVDFVEALYRRSGASVGDLDLRDVANMLRNDPSLNAINGHVRQKEISQTSGVVLVRCDGGQSIGFGHVTRSLAIARALRDQQGLGVRFAMANDENAIGRVVADGFPVDVWPAGQHEERWIERLMSTYRPCCVVYDIRTGLSREAMARLKSNSPLTVVVDDGSPRRLEGDIVVYPPVQQVEDLDWIGFKGTKLVGWEWIILPATTKRAHQPIERGGTRRILVTMGGADPLNLTWEIACKLAEMKEVVDPIFVIGPGFGQSQLLERRLRRLLPDAEIVCRPNSLAKLFNRVDIAVTMFGVTAQELAAAGVPAIYVCLDEDHFYSARSLTDRGVGITLGLGDEIDWERAADAIQSVLADDAELSLMSKRGPRLVDGRGAERLAELIGQRLADRAAA